MVDVATSLNTFCMDSPSSSWNTNKIDISTPATPIRTGSLISPALNERVLHNIDMLCAPSFEQGFLSKLHVPTINESQSEPFRMAMNRMRDGSGISKLREQLKEAETDIEPSSNKTTGENSPLRNVEKPPVNRAVALGRQPLQARKSGLARSA